jgi:hypothetical protein
MWLSLALYLREMWFSELTPSTVRYYISRVWYICDLGQLVVTEVYVDAAGLSEDQDCAVGLDAVGGRGVWVGCCVLSRI